MTIIIVTVSGITERNAS